MKDMMKDCFAPHQLMHSLFGLGLGILAVALFPGLAIAWLGIVIIVVAIVFDYVRKE